MPSEAPLVPNQSEKPHHYMYLKEFRTTQCELFLQHKCQQHRPFTCFHWHFLNQRRRKPLRKREGTFSYSPDIYCTKYDENTGICPDGDECPFLHRTAGDTERRYHLRYYKTGTCVYDTDSKGHCVKNGPHCAFAHGALDMRPPVYDSTEMQPSIEFIDKPSTSPSTEKDKVLAEDPRWMDTNFVLANYKTEPCKRPPRLCRQGYACPQFHNTRDRRRSPKQYKYRSTPCPNVKHGDEWGDPTHCESGDGCSYCHTRTEQQFHPEIYKSTKCNDMVQTKFCPRGAFCAFAHVEQEISTARDVLSLSSNSLAAFVTNVLPQSDNVSKLETMNGKDHFFNKEIHNGKSDSKLPNPIGKERANSTPLQPSLIQMNLLTGNNGHGSPFRHSPLHDPFMKGRSYSVSSDYSLPPLYMRAPGFEREESQLKLRQQLLAIEKDSTLDNVEKAKRRENLLLVHQSSLLGGPHALALTQGNTMSPLAPAFYPPGDCVESVIGKALDDVNLEDLDIGSLERELDKDMDTNSVSSSLSTGLSTSGCFSNNSSIPIGIPASCIAQRGSISSLSQSPPSPFGSFPHSMQPLLLNKQDSNDHSSSPLLNCYQSLSKYPMSDTNSMSPRSAGPQSPMLSGSFTSIHHQNGEVHRLRDELMVARSKMAEWEGVYTQAKSACEAWKREAEDANKKAKSAEEERLSVLKQKEEMASQNQRLQQLMSGSSNGGPHIRSLARSKELDNVPVLQLQQLKVQLQTDMEILDKIIIQKVQQKI